MAKPSTSHDSGQMAAQTELRSYRQLIEQLAQGGINHRIPNSIPAHAAVLLETMFRHAREEIRIFTGEMRPAVYGDSGLMDAARRFLLRPGACLRILLQTAREEAWLKEQPIVRACLAHAQPGALDIRCANGVYATPVAKHFAVMDDRGYRFELNHDKTQAIANFNEPDAARKLVSAFDRAFAMATPASLVS